MIKVITYGTYDLLHYGHRRLLERAKALGDYLIVGVTSDDYERKRGKINVKQSLMERIENVRATGLADEIIVEEYEGQKIDDILRYGVDIFTVGTDWLGKFDYLNAYCRVEYLERTEGISSSEIRTEQNSVTFGLVGEAKQIEKYFRESTCVNGLDTVAVYTTSSTLLQNQKDTLLFTDSYEQLLTAVDAVFIASHPTKHYEQIRQALLAGKHVLCESPIALTAAQCDELFALAVKNKVVLMDAIKTAYSTAYHRLAVLLKSGKIGKVVSVDATCTSLRDLDEVDEHTIEQQWNSICAWGPTAMLPVFQILGCRWQTVDITSLMMPVVDNFDLFTRVNFTFDHAVASITVGKGVKSEGELIVSGTNGYIYVPAPWWKTEYFEVRYENQAQNERLYYPLDGEGIRYELLAFVRAVMHEKKNSYIAQAVSRSICEVIEAVYTKKYKEITP